MFSDRKRVVSQRGGSQREKTKQELLEQSRAERQKREEDRRRLKAATKLQACVRANLSNKKLCEEQRQNFDKEWQQVVPALMATPPAGAEGVQLKAWCKLLRLLVFSFRREHDQTRLTNVLDLLSKTNFLQKFPHTNTALGANATQGAFLVSRIVKLSLSSLPFEGSLAQFLSAICVTKHKVLFFLSEQGFFEELGVHIRNWQRNPSTPPTSLGIAISAMHVLKDSPHHLQSFAIHILSCPRLVTQIPSTVFPPSTHNQIISSALQVFAVEKVGPITKLHIFSNLSHLLLSNANTTTTNVDVVRDLVVLASLASDIATATTANQTNVRIVLDSQNSRASQDSEDDQNDGALSNTDNALLKLSSVMGSKQNAAFVCASFSFFVSLTVSKLILNLFSSGTENAQSSQFVFSISRLVASPWVGRQFLNTLVFSSGVSIVQLLWTCVVQNNVLAALERKGVLSAPTDSPNTLANMSMLSLFCVCLSQKLVAMDDNEFLSLPPPMSWAALKKFSRSLLVITTRLVLHPRRLCTERLTLQRNGVTVLHQLHDRDSRNGFSWGGVAHWVNSEVGVSAVLQDVRAKANLVRSAAQVFPPFAPPPAVTEAPITAAVSESVSATSRPDTQGSRMDGSGSDSSDDDDVVMADMDSTDRFEKSLTILRYLPFAVPFEARVRLFRFLVDLDRSEVDVAWNEQNVPVTVKRSNLYQDAFRQLAHSPINAWKVPLRAAFINREGLNEAGVGPGVAREFLQEVLKESFDPNHGLFSATTEHQLYPSPFASVAFESPNKHFEFAGKLLGKSLYEKQLVFAPLARFFLNLLLGRRNSISDLASFDAELYTNLLKLKSTDDIASLELNFAVNDNHLDRSVTTELKPNGSNILVTNENCIEYVYLVAHHRLNVELKSQCNAFISGLASIIPLHWLRMFSPEELQMLISGSQQAIDVADLRAHTRYQGYEDNDPTVDMFWQVVSDLTDEQRHQLLRFVTSTDRAPLLGFQHLNPPFTILRVPIEGDQQRLPTAATCMNLLKLPAYDRLEVLREKLLYALAQGQTFELT